MYVYRHYTFFNCTLYIISFYIVPIYCSSTYVPINILYHCFIILPLVSGEGRLHDVCYHYFIIVSLVSGEGRLHYGAVQQTGGGHSEDGTWQGGNHDHHGHAGAGGHTQDVDGEYQWLRGATRTLSRYCVQTIVVCRIQLYIVQMYMFVYMERWSHVLPRDKLKSLLPYTSLLFDYQYEA